MTAGKDSPAVAPWRPSTTSLLMCAPDHYEVAFAINPHMTDAEGRLHAVDRELARRQWDDLRKEFESIGYAVDVLPGEPGFPDMTFAANQTFCFRRTDGTRVALISRMAHPERAGEPPYFARRFAERGYEIVESPPGLGPLEGAGDLVWHPTRRTLYCGYGFRST
ncbi:MAG TPA: amidinotransferase, partial [Planctomycetota bacterium]|nr:amidinotransferase [Planctomycetota bacterium]